MRGLRARLERLERQQSTDLSGLSDSELRDQLVEVCGQFEVAGGTLPNDWRGLIDREDFGPLTKLVVPA